MSLHSIQKAVVQPHHNDSAIVSLGGQKDLTSFLLHLSCLHVWWWGGARCGAEVNMRALNKGLEGFEGT